MLDAARKEKPEPAREKLEAAMERHGRLPSLLLGCAAADRADSGPTVWHRLATAGEAVRGSLAASGTVTLDAACTLINAVGFAYGYGTALQLAAGLPAASQQTGEVRSFTGWLHNDAGNYALAVAASGDPRYLDKEDRQLRRRSRRRMLIRGITRRSHGFVPPIDPASFDVPPAAVASTLDQISPIEDDYPRVREVLNSAMAEHGRHPLLLLSLVINELDSGDRHAAAALARELLRAAADHPLIAGPGVYRLLKAGCPADALRTLAADHGRRPQHGGRLHARPGRLPAAARLAVHRPGSRLAALRLRRVGAALHPHRPGPGLVRATGPGA